MVVMIELTQERFEELWNKKDSPAVLIWFTASWCGPCRRMDKEALKVAADAAGLLFYVCDITVNDYTPGYCGIQAFPTFMLIKPGEVLGRLTDSNTVSVCNWIKTIINF